MKKCIGIIPARYASTRFPGKPLADIGGKPMIQRVYERTQEVMEHVLVATDDERIIEAVQAFGGKSVMTSPEHQSGTDRCAEALKLYSKEVGLSFDVVVNVQGDEPFIRPEQISQVISCFEDPKVDIATLIKEIDELKVVFNPNKPKVVVDIDGFALYFSRSAIPHVRQEKKEDWLDKHNFFQHIGMYAYRSQVLNEITKLPQGLLEQAESLEQLRWLENGYAIKTELTEHESYGIDTPADLEEAVRMGLV